MHTRTGRTITTMTGAALVLALAGCGGSSASADSFAFSPGEVEPAAFVAQLAQQNSVYVLKTYQEEMTDSGLSTRFTAEVDDRDPNTPTVHVTEVEGPSAGTEMITRGDELYTKFAGASAWSEGEGSTDMDRFSTVAELMEELQQELSLKDVQYLGDDHGSHHFQLYVTAADAESSDGSAPTQQPLDLFTNDALQLVSWTEQGPRDGRVTVTVKDIGQAVRIPSPSPSGADPS